MPGGGGASTPPPSRAAIRAVSAARFSAALGQLRGMGVAGGAAQHGPQPEPLVGVVGGGPEPAVVEAQDLGAAAFQEQLAVVRACNRIPQDGKRGALVQMRRERVETGDFIHRELLPPA